MILEHTDGESKYEFETCRLASTNAKGHRVYATNVFCDYTNDNFNFVMLRWRSITEKSTHYVSYYQSYNIVIINNDMMIIDNCVYASYARISVVSIERETPEPRQMPENLSSAISKMFIM